MSVEIGLGLTNHFAWNGGGPQVQPLVRNVCIWWPEEALKQLGAAATDKIPLKGYPFFFQELREGAWLERVPGALSKLFSTRRHECAA